MELKKVPVKVAAEILGKSEQFVRCGLQYQTLNFGKAVTSNPNKKPRPHFSYHISPKLFMEYAGCTAEEIASVARKLGDIVSQSAVLKEIHATKKAEKKAERQECKQYTLSTELPPDACRLIQGDIRDTRRLDAD